MQQKLLGCRKPPKTHGKGREAKLAFFRCRYGRSVQPESAVPKGPAALRAAEERMAARLPASRAERAMAEITEGQALWKRFEAQAEADEKSRELHGPSGIAQRKARIAERSWRLDL